MVIFVDKNINMLIYNTTYHLEDKDESHFIIWIKECYIPEIEKSNLLKNPRFCKILSHQEEGVCYSMQWEVESSEILHKWYRSQGSLMAKEMVDLFKERVIGFPTLMEIVE